MPQYGFDMQLKIYSAPLLGQTSPVFPVSFEEWRASARQVLSDGPFGYVDGGAGGEQTMASNVSAFQKYAIRSRMLRNVETRDWSIQLFGRTLPTPFLLAPIGVQSIIHQEAEYGPAKAASQKGIPFVLSTVSSVRMEDIAASMGSAPKWFQLYPSRDPGLNRSFIQRAESAGYEALVVTVDTTMLGWREVDLRNAYLPFLQGQGVANYFSDPVFRNRLSQSPERDAATAIQEFLKVYVNPAFTWEDLAELRTWTKLPMLVKGITHPLDVDLAIQHGMDGVIVSNHGGRQVDGGVPALEALVEIRDRIGGVFPLLLDSGIRRAADVVKAVALGANAVLVGRPYAYALAVGGQQGVGTWLSCFLAEFDLEMALAGYRTVAELTPDAVVRLN